MIVLALDPSLTAFGCAIVDTESRQILSAFHVSTIPGTGPVTVSDTWRLNYIAKQLTEKCLHFKVKQIWAEGVVGSKSSKAAKALHLCKGMLVGLSCGLGLPLLFCTARDVKKHLTQDPKADKNVVMEAVKREFGDATDKVLGGPKYAREAVSDALAVCLYFLDGSKTNASTAGP